MIITLFCKKHRISIDKGLLDKLKPHQLEGIEFMWDNSCENIDMFDKKKEGKGCILAQETGLGKQVFYFNNKTSAITSSFFLR